MRKLIVFDLCETLYAANTTTAFLRQYAEQAHVPQVATALNRWTDRGSALFYLGALAHRLFGWDLARQRLIASLKGQRTDDLVKAARDLARSFLPPLANGPLQDRLAEHKAAGDWVVIVSNSLDVVVAPIAADLGTEFRASELQFTGDRCTGRLAKDLTGRKAEAVRGMIDGDPPEIWVYTDNRSDSDLVALADRSFIVIPKGKPVRHWGNERSEYVQL